MDDMTTDDDAVNRKLNRSQLRQSLLPVASVVSVLVDEVAAVAVLNARLLMSSTQRWWTISMRPLSLMVLRLTVQLQQTVQPSLLLLRRSWMRFLYAIHNPFLQRLLIRYAVRI